MYPGRSHSAPPIVPITPGTLDADRRRAATQNCFQNTTQAADNGPLVCDLQTPRVGYHWAVDYLCANGVAVTNQPNDSALSGLFIVPANSLVETLANANSGDGALMSKRGWQIPCDLKVNAIGNNKFAFSYVAKIGRPLIVPSGFVIRFLSNIAPATAVPGPGTNSTVLVSAQVSIEPN